MARHKFNPAEPATDRAELTDPKEYRRASLANKQRAILLRRDDITSSRNRTIYGVETGPWVGRVPHGWIGSELTRIRSGPGRGDLLAMREGSLVHYPSGWIWLDHSALGFVELGWAGEVPLEEVTDTALPRRQRGIVTTLKLGLWTFTLSHEAFARLSAFDDVAPDRAEEDFSALIGVIQERQRAKHREDAFESRLVPTGATVP
jgi:hypothetical protein